MENLNSKLKKLFSAKPRKFKGQGHVLGSRAAVRFLSSRVFSAGCNMT